MKSINQAIRDNLSLIKDALKLLPQSARKKLAYISIIQVLFSFLDLVGVALIGVIAALSVAGVNFGSSGNRVSTVLRFLHIEQLQFQYQVAILAISASSFMILKTILSWFFSKRIYFFLGNQGANISMSIYSKLFNLPYSEIRKLPIQRTIASILDSVNVITIGILGTLTTVLADLSLILLLSAGLLFIAPYVALISMAIFILFGVILNKQLGTRSRNIGTLDFTAKVSMSQLVSESIGAFREIHVRNAKGIYINRLAELRHSNAVLQAETALMPNLSKYIIETAMLIGGLVIAASQFLLNDAKHAISIFSIFIAAGARLTPAILRLQQSTFSIKRSLASVEAVNTMITKLGSTSDLVANSNNLSALNRNFGIMANDLAFQFEDSTKQVLNSINLDFRLNTLNAIAGDSGAGKSTLVDLMLGLIKPTRGNITLLGISPGELIKLAPDSIGYVPQEVYVIDGTVRENLLIGLNSKEISDASLVEALRKARLTVDSYTLPNGLDTLIGENGKTLSGGQRQRLGIARALVTHPKFLILDEATSSLDAQTESEIVDEVNSLKNEMTIVVVAHRLSTIMKADQIIYLSKGEILGSGNFTELIKTVPEFAARAKKLGL